MTTRSIIEIDVRDQAFKEFAALFEKYREDVETVPNAWAKVDKAVKSTANPFKKIGLIVGSTAEQIHKAEGFQEKLRISAQGSAKAFHAMGQSAGKLAVGIKDITLNLLRWGSLTSVFASLLGGASLFGLDRLAQAASASRREAQGLGITPGEHEAARLNYSKVADVDFLLTRINEAKWDVTKRSAFNAAGLSNADWEGKNSADLMKQLLPQIKAKLEQGDGTKQYADASGLSQFADMETLTRLRAMSKEELAAMEASYESDKRLLSISDQTQRAWQDLDIQLKRAGLQIAQTLVKDLVSLTSPLSKLSNAFAAALDTFLKSPKVGEWIDELADGLQKLASYLTSDDFANDLRSVMDSLDRFGGALIAAGRMLGKVFDFGGERGLKASEYAKLDELRHRDPKLAKAEEWALKNPSGKFNWVSLSTPQKDLQSALKAAQPDARSLAESLFPGNVRTFEHPESDSVSPKIEADDEQKHQAFLKIADATLAKMKLASKDAAAPIVPTSASAVAAPAVPSEAYKGFKFGTLEKQYALPPGLLESVEKRESAGDPKATSPKGAKGPFQFMDAAWQQYGAGGNIRDEAQAATAAAKFYHELLVKYKGDVAKALTAYNWGTGNLDRKGLENAPSETRAYVAAIMADMAKRTGAQGAVTAGAGATAPPARPAVAQAATTPQTINIQIWKATGADVNTTINALGAGT